MLRLLCTAEFDDGWTERFGKLVEIDRVGFSLDKDPDKRYWTSRNKRKLIR